MIAMQVQRFRQSLQGWLHRKRQAEAGEVYLHHRRVYIVPTSAGLALGLMLVVIFLGAVNYTLSLGLALTFSIAACALVDVHLTFRNLAFLHLAAGHAQAVFVGEEAEFALQLINRRKHDRYAVFLRFDGREHVYPEQACDIAAFSMQVVKLSTPSQKRGWMNAPRVMLETRFPLGFLRAWSYWQPDARILVYPFPETDAPPLPLEGVSLEDGQGRAGQDDFAGIRSYKPGDAMKHLAWRQIAKVDLTLGGQLVTKHFEGGANNQLCLDFSTLPASMDVELKLSRMARWVLVAEQRGLAYSFRLGGNDFEPALGAAHQAACLRALALYGLSDLNDLSGREPT